MPFVSLACPNCGAPLILNKNQITKGDVVRCQHCNTQITMEDMPDITNVINNKTNVEHADTVILNDDQSIEAQLTNAETLVGVHHLYGEAEKKFSQLTKTASMQWRAWWGLARAITENLTKTDITSARFEEAKRAKNGALAVAGPDAKHNLTKQWNDYERAYRNAKLQLNNNIASVKQQLAANRAKWETASKNRENLQSELEALQRQWSEINTKMNSNRSFAILPVFNPVFGCFTFFIVLGIIAGGLSSFFQIAPSLLVIFIPIALWYLFFNRRADARKPTIVAIEQQIADVQRQLSAQETILTQCVTHGNDLEDQQRTLESRL